MNLVKFSDIITSLLAFLITSVIAIILLTAISALFASSKYKTYSKRFYGRLPVMSFFGIAWGFLASYASGSWRNLSSNGTFFLIVSVVIYVISVHRLTYWLAHKRSHGDDNLTIIKNRTKDEKASNDFSRLVAERYTQSSSNEEVKAKRATEMNKATLSDIDYVSLAESIFKLSVEFMYKYGNLVNSVDPTISSMNYLQDSTNAGTSLYVYAMVKIRNQLKRRFTNKAEFEEQDTKMIHIFADKLMESPVSLMKKMDFTASNISSYKPPRGRALSRRRRLPRLLASAR